MCEAEDNKLSGGAQDLVRTAGTLKLSVKLTALASAQEIFSLWEPHFTNLLSPIGKKWEMVVMEAAAQ
jgi:hypothetical protein